MSTFLMHYEYYTANVVALVTVNAVLSYLQWQHQKRGVNRSND